MAEVTASAVKSLREKSGAGMIDCKNALVEANGDENAAMEILRRKGIAQAGKKDRATFTGRIAHARVASHLDACDIFVSPHVPAADGSEFFEAVIMTPRAPTFTSDKSGNVYFTKWTLAIPGHNACLSITSAPADQEFIIPGLGKLNNNSVYEAVSTVGGTWDGKPVGGQSWNEQAD